MRISVITPSFNAAKYIERAIRSVLEQDYDAVEHIVVDGLSDDGTVAILEKFPHLKWVSEKDAGQSDAMNKGFAMATGDVIVYLNADDYFLPGVFRAVAEAFVRGAQIVMGDLRVVPNNGHAWIQKPSSDYRDLLMHWKGLFPINPVQYFIRRPLHEGIAYNVDNHLSMDHEFLLQLFRKASPVHLERVFGVFDMVDGSKTAEGLKAPLEYWSYRNFRHIDSFLMALPPEEIIEFKNLQCEFFRTQQHKHIFLGFNALRREIDRYDHMVIYGAGSQFDVFHVFFAEKTTHVVDQNPLLHGTVLHGHQVLPPSRLFEMEAPTIFVTAFGYREAIAEALEPVKGATLVFIEDFFR